MRKTKKPKFLRQEWFRMGNQRKKWLKWRSVRGNQSKLRQHIKGKGFMPTPGYGTDARLYGLHPSGLKDVIVSNTADLVALDPKTCGARIAAGVGARKRYDIQAEAERLNIKVFNPKKVELRKKKVVENVKAK